MKFQIKKLIIKSTYVKGKLFIKTIINEFNNNFELLRTIQSEKIDIKTNDWIIYEPTIQIKIYLKKK